MNLINLFNFNYLKQNLKKSKGALAIFIGIIPIINILSLFMMSDNYYYSSKVITLSDISIINFIGIFILPIVISICLFGYVFKKKSVDFVNSMPISRKSIFITNTIGGISILILMNLINTVFIYVLSSTLPNLIIPTEMIFDYFILWSVAYIFVFTVSNIAVSVSGNMITSIIVSALILFLVPFIHFFANNALVLGQSNDYIMECNSKDCETENYYNYENELADLVEEHKYSVNLHKKVKESNYTIPSNFIFRIATNSNKDVYNTTSIIKSFILSIIYIIVGYFLFLKRKMEVSETSFKNITVHNIVKCLTMVPILSFIYLFLKEATFDLVPILILLVIIIGYYFIYDLITRKNINNLRKNIVTLVIYLPLFMLIMFCTDKLLEDNKIVKVENIEAMKVTSNSSTKLNERVYNTYFEDKELLNYILKTTGYSTKEGEEYISFTLKAKNNIEYVMSFNFDKKDYDYVISKISENKDIIESVNNTDYDNIYVIKLGSTILTKEDTKQLVELCRKHLPNNVLENFEGLNMSMYSYTNHEVKNYEITTDNKIIVNKLMEIENKELAKVINDYKYFELHYSASDVFLTKEGEAELFNYIKNNINKKVDSSMEYKFIEVSDYSKNKFYRYYTNDVEGLKELLEKYKIEDNNNTSEEYYYD